VSPRALAPFLGEEGGLVAEEVTGGEERGEWELEEEGEKQDGKDGLCAKSRG